MLLSSGGNWRLLAAFGVFSFLALSLAHSGRPAMFDEWYWLWGAKGILSEGVPVFYNDSGTPRFEGTGHPPLYTYLVAFTAWATSDYQKTKLLGIAFFLGTLFLTFKTAKIVFGERTAWISASLLSLAPFSVVGSTLIDPDTTTLPFFLSLFAFYYTKSINEKHPQTNLLSASLTLVFWSKFQGILFPLSSLAFHALRNDKTGVKRSFYLLAAGAALFFFTWTVFSSFTGLNFYCPFQHNSPFKMGCPSETLGGSGLFSFSDSKALPALGVARSLAFWLSPFFFLFFFAALRSNLTGFSKVNEKTGVIASYSLLGLLFVLLAGVGFSGLPKYFFSVLPFASMLAASFVAKIDWENFSNPVLFLSFAFFSVLYYSLGDPLLLNALPRELLKDPHSVYDFAVRTIGLLAVIVSAPVLFSAARSSLSGKKLTIDSIAAFSFIAMIAFFASLNAIHAQATYSLVYYYGEGGLVDATDFASTLKGSIEGAVIAPSEFFWPLGSPKTYLPLLFSKPESQVVLPADLEVVVLRQREYSYYGYDLRGLLERNSFHLMESVGDFDFYEKVTE